VSADALDPDGALCGTFRSRPLWKLAIVLEGSYAKFQRGESKKAVHEFFGLQTDMLLESATSIVEEH
jgi:hypothetical protein